jgi:kynurenine formamidase
MIQRTHPAVGRPQDTNPCRPGTFRGWRGDGIVAKIGGMKTIAGLLATVELMVVSLTAANVPMPSPGFLPALQQRIQDSLEALDADVRSTASQVRTAGLLGAEARQALDRLARAHACAIDGATVDMRGIMRVVAPEDYRRFEGADLSQQAQVRRLQKTRQPVLSASFTSVEGIDAVDLEHPVFDAQGKLLGSVSLLIKPEILLRDVAERSSLPAGWDVWLIETTGRFLYGSKKAAIGKNLFRDSRYQPFPSLRALGRRMARQTDGGGTYEFAEPGETPTSRQAFWTTVSLHGTAWRLLVTCRGQEPGSSLLPRNVLDLTYPYDENTIYWPTAEPFKLDRVARGTNETGWWYASNNYGASEHGGTHADAPIHFAFGGRTMEQIPVTEWIAPAVKIDATQACGRDRDYQLTVENILAWEKKHGRIPDRAWVIMYTGVGTQFYPDKVKVLGTATTGKEALPKLSFPGFSPESATFLVTHRKITGIALDTPSIDRGKALDFMVHRILCAANKLALENLANLDRLPSTGAMLHAIPMLIRDGTGAPARVYAVWP